jgi:hypothetical protein
LKAPLFHLELVFTDYHILLTYATTDARNGNDAQIAPLKASEQGHEWHLLEPTAVTANEENSFPWGIPARCFSLDDQTDIAIVERLCHSDGKANCVNVLQKRSHKW